MVASLQSLLLAFNSSKTKPKPAATQQHSQANFLLVRAMQNHALRRSKQMGRTKSGGGAAAGTWTRRQRMISKNRRALRIRGSAKPAASHILRRIRTLQRLVPNSESSELDSLFREAADYIKRLQMQVKLMQIMVSMVGA